MPKLKIKTPRWAKPLLKPSRYKGAYGGRGSGKSHHFAEDVVEAHILDPSSSTVCVREVQKSLNQSVKRLVEDKIQAMGAGHYFDVMHDQIRMKKGNGRIIFQGLATHTAESIKSLEDFDRCWVEEAQVMSQRSLDMLRPTIRKDNSELWFSWNPRLKTDPIDVLLRGDNPPDDAIVVRVNYDDNPWFPDVLRAEMEYDRKRDNAKYKHIWLGEYLQNTNGSVDEFEAPDDALFRLGADWGFAVDPTVLVRCHIIGRKLYIDYEAYQIGCEITDTPDLFGTVPESDKWPIISDSARPETISHMKAHGFPKIMAALKGPGSLEDGVEWLKSYDIVVHPRCTHTIDELSTYSWKVDPLTDAILPVLEDKQNHVIDALRYACEGARRATRQEYKPIDYEALGFNAGIV